MHLLRLEENMRAKVILVRVQSENSFFVLTRSQTTMLGEISTFKEREWAASREMTTHLMHPLHDVSTNYLSSAR